jgi:hypothetical protein
MRFVTLFVRSPKLFDEVPVAFDTVDEPNREMGDRYFNPGWIFSTNFSNLIEIPFVTTICLR